MTEESGRLYIQATAQPRFELLAEKETKFFLKVTEAQITFERDAAGAVTLAWRCIRAAATCPARR